MTHRCIAAASLEGNNRVDCRGVASRVSLAVHSSATVIMTDLGKYFSWRKNPNGCIITSEPCPLKPDHMGPTRSRKDTSHSTLRSSRPRMWKRHFKCYGMPRSRKHQRISKLCSCTAGSERYNEISTFSGWCVSCGSGETMWCVASHLVSNRARPTVWDILLLFRIAVSVCGFASGFSDICMLCGRKYLC